MNQKKITITYFIAVSIIAANLIFGQFLIQHLLKKQVDDGHVINLAGRQRMLSQRIVKEVLYKHVDTSSSKTNKENFEQNISLLKEVHYNLMQEHHNLQLHHHNSLVVDQLFLELDPKLIAFIKETKRLYYSSKIDNLNSLMSMEHDFLLLMDEIVNQYELEDREKLIKISQMETILLGIALIILILETLFIFLPMRNRILQNQKRIQDKNKFLHSLHEENRKIHNELIQNQKRLEVHNKDLEEAKNKISSQKEDIEKLANSLEYKINERTSTLQNQKEMLEEYAFLNAHEVRGPLTNILGLVTLNSKEKLTQEQLEANSILIRRAAEDLDKVIKKMNMILEKVNFYEKQ